MIVPKTLSSDHLVKHVIGQAGSSECPSCSSFRKWPLPMKLQVITRKIGGAAEVAINRHTTTIGGLERSREARI